MDRWICLDTETDPGFIVSGSASTVHSVLNSVPLCSTFSLTNVLPFIQIPADTIDS